MSDIFSNAQVETGTTNGTRNVECESESGTVTESVVDSAVQAAPLSSLEELVSGLAKRVRRRPILDRQPSDSSSWTTCGEDGGSERVRFDDHVSFIEADQEAGPSNSCPVVAASRGTGRRKRNKEHDQDIDTASKTTANSRLSDIVKSWGDGLDFISSKTFLSLSI